LNKVVLLLAALAISNAAIAQVEPTVKEGSKATAQKADQVGDEAKGAVSSEPRKSIAKSKAKVHKAKAHHHAKKAKRAAKTIGHDTSPQ
jgi:hypothetical protein